MNPYTALAIQYLVVPLLKGIANVSIAMLKKAPNGIPKKLALTLLEAITESEANEVSQDHVKQAKEVLQA